MWVFESEHIKYRLMTLDDTEEVLKWRNSDIVRPNFFYQEIITKEVHESYYHNKIKNGTVIQFIMSDSLSLEEFGCVYFSNINSDKKTAESGVFIGNENYLNKGFGTEAIGRLIKYGFDEMKLERIDMRVRAENIRSIKAHEKVGFSINMDLVNEYDFSGSEDEVVFMSIYNKSGN